MCYSSIARPFQIFFQWIEIPSWLLVINYFLHIGDFCGSCCQEGNRRLENLKWFAYRYNVSWILWSAATEGVNFGVTIHYNLYAAAAQMANRCWMLAGSPSELYFFPLPTIPIAEMKEKNNKVEKLQNEAIKMIKGMIQY